MLGTKYHVYKHLDTETTLIRTTSYSLPSVLRGHVTVITPSTYFNLAKPRHRHSSIQKAEGITFQVTDSWENALGVVSPNPTCKDKIIPSCLDALQHILYARFDQKEFIGCPRIPERVCQPRRPQGEEVGYTDSILVR